LIIDHSAHVLIRYLAAKRSRGLSRASRKCVPKLSSGTRPLPPIDCRTDNQILVGELTNWRVQKLMLKPPAAGGATN